MRPSLIKADVYMTGELETCDTRLLIMHELGSDKGIQVQVQNMLERCTQQVIEWWETGTTKNLPMRQIETLPTTWSVLQCNIYSCVQRSLNDCSAS